MGPTYLWFQFQQMQELGRAFGLSQPELDAGLSTMVMGAAKTYFASALSPEEVIDLVPVKPLHDDEEVVRRAYQTRLSAIYQKLKD
jgi:pyrroline-5-carboxylate reductase